MTDLPNRHCECCGRDLGAPVSATPSSAAAEPVAPSPGEKNDWIGSLWSELMNTPPPAQSEWVEPEPKRAAPPAPPSPPAPAQTAPSIVATPTPAPIVPAAPEPPVALVEPIRIEPVKPVAPARPQPPSPKTTSYAPVVVRSRPKKSVTAWLPVAAALVLAAGVGAYWLKVQEREAALADNKEPARASKPAKPASDSGASKANAAARERSPEPAPAEVKTRVAQARPAARQTAAVTTKPRLATTPAREPIPSASVSVPAVVTAPPAAARVVASTAAPATAPQGPFFEPTDVHEAPRVASRVAPNVPADLRAQARNEIVIVRMLISQIGRPSRVTLLRKSKSGPRLDDAVIAAVNQWTFSPARRKGEAVSSWFNIGIPVMAN